MTQTSIKSFMLKDASVLEETKELKFSQFDEPFVIRSLTAEEFDNLTKRATRHNKQNGAMTTELDQKKFTDLMAIEAIVTPDLNDAELQEFYGTIGKPAETVRKMLTAGQWGKVLSEVNELSGFNKESVDELVEEVKN